MAADYKNLRKNEDLRLFLKTRLDFGISQFKREQLIQLCELVEKYNLPKRTTPEEEALKRQNRQDEILNVSSSCKLPDPGDPKIVWSAAFSDFPTVNLLHVYSYFVEKPSRLFDTETLKAYKSMSSYQSAADGFVDEIFISKDLPEDWVFVKGVVSASQRRGRKYKAWCLMKKDVSLAIFCLLLHFLCS